MYLTVRGLVLRQTPYNDTDVLLTVLTQRHGKLTLKARMLRRKSGPLTAACQIFAYSEFTLFEYRGMYTINEAQSIELFSELQRDLQKLSLAAYFAQVAEVVSQEDLPNPALLSLTLNCMYALSKLSLPEDQVKGAFELRCACLSGFTPDLSACHTCGNETPDRFDLSAGRLECGACRDPASDGVRLPISEGVLRAMRYLCFCDASRLFSFRLPEASMEQLSQVTQGYLATQLERGFSALDFYKSLLNTGENYV